MRFSDYQPNLDSNRPSIGHPKSSFDGLVAFERTGAEIPTTKTPANQINKWIQSNPSLVDIYYYLKRYQEEGTFTLEQYCGPLVEKLISTSKGAGANAGLAQQGRDLLQGLVFSEFERITEQDVKVGRGLSPKVLHACGHLSITHPIISNALNAFGRCRKIEGIGKPHSDLETLIRLARENNLFSVNAVESFIDVLSLYRKAEFPNATQVNAEIKRLFATVLTADSSNYQIRELIAGDLRTLGARQFNDAHELYRFAIVWSFANPLGSAPLPRHVEQALINSKRKIRMDEGRVEHRFSRDIISGIYEALGGRYSKQQIDIGRSVSLPYNCGPFNTDFFVTAGSGAKVTQLAIEINGSQHYCLSRDGLLLSGADLLKDKILSAYGIKVINFANSEILKAASHNLKSLVSSRVSSVLNS